MAAWASVSISCPNESQEAVAALLFDLGCQGVEERQGALAGSFQAECVTADLLARLKERLSSLGDFGLEPAGPVQVEFVNDADWAEAWKKHFKPLRLGKRLVIRPSWERHDTDEGRVEVTLDPGMAFGTGTHATTRLCLVALEDYVRSGMVIADIGTGSGILALAAAKLGASAVHATDTDPLARRVAWENAVRNGLDDRIRVYPVEEFAGLPDPCDLVVANILADTLIELASSVRARLKPGSLFIGSGIIDERIGDVVAAYELLGFGILEVRENEVWRAIVARGPSD